jgi:hypothetical protein
MYGPWCLMFAHGIRERQPRTPAGGQRPLRGRARCAQARINLLEDWLVADGDERPQVQGGADRGWPAPHRAVPTPRATVSVEGSDAYQRRERLPMQPPQLGQLSHPGAREDRAHAWDTVPQVLVRPPSGSRLDAVPQVRVDLLQRMLQPVDMRLEPWVQATGSGTQPVVLRRQPVDALASAQQQAAQRLALRLRQRPWVWPHSLGPRGQPPGRTPSGVGQLAWGFSDVARVTRLDHHHGQVGRRQRDRHRPRQSPRGLQHHHRRASRLQTLHQGRAPVVIRGATPLVPHGPQRQIPARCGHVNTDQHAGCCQASSGGTPPCTRRAGLSQAPGRALTEQHGTPLALPRPLTT